MREGLSGNSDNSVVAQVQRRQRGQREERLIFNHIDLMAQNGGSSSSKKIKERSICLKMDMQDRCQSDDAITSITRHPFSLFYIEGFYLVAGQPQSAEPLQSAKHAAFEQRQVVARQFQRQEIVQTLEESAGQSAAQSVVAKIEFLQFDQAAQGWRNQLRGFQEIGAQLETPQAGRGGKDLRGDGLQGVAAEVEEAEPVQSGERLAADGLDAVVGQVQSLEMDERAERFRRNADQSIVGQAQGCQRLGQAGKGLLRHVLDLARRDDQSVERDPLEQVRTEAAEILDGQVQQGDRLFERQGPQSPDDERDLLILRLALPGSARAAERVRQIALARDEAGRTRRIAHLRARPLGSSLPSTHGTKAVRRRRRRRSIVLMKIAIVPPPPCPLAVDGRCRRPADGKEERGQQD